MRKIDTLAELKAERIRLRQKQLFLEKEIEDNFKALKESFSPLTIATNGAAKILVNRNHGLANEAVNLVSDFVLKKIFLKNSGFILRFLIPFVARNAANNLLHENKKKILGWLADLVLKLGDKDKNEIYDKATADTNF